MKDREQCKDLVLSALSSMPEVTAIYMCGSEITPKKDYYSDFDFTVISSDLNKTYTSYVNILSSISPIIGYHKWDIEKDHFIDRIQLKDFSFYHKIDLVVFDNIEKCEKAGAGPYVLFYKKDSGPASSVSEIEAPPVQFDANFQMMYELFMISGFTKSFFRKSELKYRIWAGVHQHLLVLLHEKYSAWNTGFSQQKLPRKEQEFLFQHIDSHDKSILDSIFPHSGQMNLGDSFQRMVRLYVELSRQKAYALKQVINEAFVTAAFSFLEAELIRYKNGK